MTETYQPYFCALRLSNVRCFAQTQTLHLTRPDGRPARFTFLLGENGTGKTTALRMLAHMRPSDEALHPIDGTVSLHTAGSPTPWEPREMTADMMAWRAELDIAFSRGIDAAPERVEKLFEEFTTWVGDSYHEHFHGPTPCTSLVVGYGPLRRSGDSQLTADTWRDAVSSLFSETGKLINAEEWYLQRDYAANNPRNNSHDRERAANARDRVGRLLAKVLPDVEAVEPVTPDPVKGVTHLMARTPYGMRRISELGFGYQTTLAWVVDLAARMMAAYPESENPLSEPAVVLIDEIDLHLHPKWQRTLLTELAQRFPNVQFIATAHSPLIVQAAPEANVAVLRREGDHVVIDRAPESVRNWRIDQILTSDLYGLPSARPAHLDAKYRRREEILRKLKPTAAERAELASLRDELGASPEGESRALLEAEEIMLALTRERTTIEKGAKPRAKPRPKAGATPRRRRA